MPHVIRPDAGEARLDALQRHGFRYFLNETSATNGLVADRTQPGAPASIAAVGFALAAYPAGVERAWMARSDAIDELLYGGPLFIHQYSHVFVDFRGIQDAFARDRGFDYCDNSRRATYVQQEYALRNPRGFAGYGPHFWGLTASDGPGWTTQRVRGIDRTFFGYVARGAPYGPDDGTVAPWAVVASLPFAPEIVLPTIHHFQDVYPQVMGEYCLRCSFNLTFANEGDAGRGWTSPYHYGINLGPVVLMCENHRSGLLWRLMRSCPYVVTGLRRAGFTNGWL